MLGVLLFHSLGARYKMRNQAISESLKMLAQKTAPIPPRQAAVPVKNPAAAKSDNRRSEKSGREGIMNVKIAAAPKAGVEQAAVKFAPLERPKRKTRDLDPPTSPIVRRPLAFLNNKKNVKLSADRADKIGQISEMRVASGVVFRKNVAELFLNHKKLEQLLLPSARRLVGDYFKRQVINEGLRSFALDPFRHLGKSPF